MNKFLITAAFSNGVAALLHIGCIYFGASWYRFFGAGEQMAIWAEQGDLKPTIITSFIVVVLSLFTLYALSGAKVIRKVPLLKLGLVGMTTIFLVRGVGGFWMMGQITEQSVEFWVWSSMICFSMGIFHLIGTIQTWNDSSGVL